MTTLITREQYSDFCRRCHLLGFYYQESMAEPKPLAEVADWMVQHPQHLQRFLAEHAGDQDDVEAMRQELDWIETPTGKNGRACEIIQAWIRAQL
jgi:hypothetical protein